MIIKPHTPRRLFGLFAHVDWFLFAAALFISLLGLATMRNFTAENFFFERQTIWVIIAALGFLAASLPDYSFLRHTPVPTVFYAFLLALLMGVLGAGALVMGATTRFDLGLFAVQPADPMKLVLVMVLAKYFARRHIEIAHIRHIIVSGGYALLAFGLIFLQPDMGSAITIFSIWLGLVLVSGISWKHLAAFFFIGAIVCTSLWFTVLKPYQKARIVNFIHPLADIRGTGYNAYQSTVAVGSGELTGKGIGYGTQSKLHFLPEFQTDFIFAAYAEEWGFVGVLILFGLYGVVVIRILMVAAHAENNFSTLMVTGIAIYFISQFTVHAGMDMGLVPITGTTLPFMSYGGSHLLTEYVALGIVMSVRRARSLSGVRTEHTEFVGPV